MEIPHKPYTEEELELLEEKCHQAIIPIEMAQTIYGPGYEIYVSGRLVAEEDFESDTIFWLMARIEIPRLIREVRRLKDAAGEPEFRVAKGAESQLVRAASKIQSSESSPLGLASRKERGSAASSAAASDGDESDEALEARRAARRESREQAQAAGGKAEAV